MMPPSTFSVFLDEDISSQTSLQSLSTSSRKPNLLHNAPEPATKENINPLTGLSFDTQPPLKKRKPSSTSALKVKALPSSSRPSSKAKRLSSTSQSKEKGKKRGVLCSSGHKNAVVLAESEAEGSRIALGNRRAYEFTVMPLGDVTQAYDESEAARAMTRAGCCAVEDNQQALGMTALKEVTEENDTEMHDLSSIKPTQTSQVSAVITTEA